ncbi:hypothetical protein SRABI96_00560 [Peribacillus sp. Bi96]|nr:hypothetical protein SRABI96_00560 [Peribacillus sp. Bi96]
MFCIGFSGISSIENTVVGEATELLHFLKDTQKQFLTGTKQGKVLAHISK